MVQEKVCDVDDARFTRNNEGPDRYKWKRGSCKEQGEVSGIWQLGAGSCTDRYRYQVLYQVEALVLPIGNMRILERRLRFENTPLGVIAVSSCRLGR